MFKSKLLKVFALGLCMSAFFTGAAFAQSAGGSSSAYSGPADAVDSKLLDKQTEVDQYLFADHAKEIEKKGFQVVYTGVVDNFVEIGITPYSDENAEYLYGIFGKDNVKVTASEEATLYTTTDAAVDKGAAEDIATTSVAADTAVADTDAAEPVSDEKVYKEDEKLNIQIESVEEGEKLEKSDEIYQTTAADTSTEDVQLVSAAVDTEKSEGLSAPVMILIIAGGAAVIGGGIIISGKKKAEK